MSEQPKVDSHVVGFMLDSVETLTKLNAEISCARWHLYMGDEQRAMVSLSKARAELRQLKTHLEMVEHCHRESEDEKKQDGD